MVLEKVQQPVLLIRGLLRESRHWLNFPALLSDRLQTPVLTLDLPGCGALFRQRSAASVPELRQQLQQQLLSAYPQYQEQAVHLVAISMGGMLALDWALNAPEQVKSLVLINSSSAGLSPFWQRLQPRQYPTILRALVASVEQREALIWNMTVNKAVESAVLQQWQLWAKQCPVSRANALRQLWAASRFKVSAVPNCAVTVLCSDQDQLVSSTCSKALAQQLRAVLSVHPGSGHDLPLDDSEWMLAQLCQHFDSLHSEVSAL